MKLFSNHFSSLDSLEGGIFRNLFLSQLSFLSLSPSLTEPLSPLTWLLYEPLNSPPCFSSYPSEVHFQHHLTAHTLMKNFIIFTLLSYSHLLFICLCLLSFYKITLMTASSSCP